MVAGACPPTAPWKEQKMKTEQFFTEEIDKKEEDISAKKETTECERT